MGLTFKIAVSLDEKKAVLAMRKKIFVEEQGISAALDDDGKDENSIHLMAINDNGELVASGRLTITQSEGVLSRIAVAKDHRGHSLGKQIVTELEAIAQKNHVSHLRLSPHAYLEKFYRNLGYQTEPGGEHAVSKYTLLVMNKPLTT
jgi:predicted GNAT family N-acyltransferase